MRRYDALARHERAQHADSQIKVFNLGIVSQLVQIELDELEGGDIQSVGNVK